MDHLKTEKNVFVSNTFLPKPKNEDQLSRTALFAFICFASMIVVSITALICCCLFRSGWWCCCKAQGVYNVAKREAEAARPSPFSLANPNPDVVCSNV